MSVLALACVCSGYKVLNFIIAIITLGILLPFLLINGKKNNLPLLFKFIAKSIYTVFFVSAISLYLVEQFIDIPTGDGGMIVFWILALFVIVMFGTIIGHVLYWRYNKTSVAAPVPVPERTHLGAEVWPILVLGFWLFGFLNLFLVLASPFFHLQGIGGEIEWLLVLFSIVGAGAWKYRLLRNRLSFKKTDIYLLAAIPISIVAYANFRDYIPPIANTGAWKKYYVYGGGLELEPRKDLNRIFRTGQKEEEIDRFWKSYGPSGVAYVVRVSGDLKDHRLYKHEFSRRMLARVKDRSFAPELRRIMFDSLLGSTVRSSMFAMNATFTHDEIRKMSEMGEYIPGASIDPRLEREIEKLGVGQAMNIYASNTIPNNIGANLGELLDNKDKFLFFAEKVSHSPYPLHFQKLAGQYLKLHVLREEKFGYSGLLEGATTTINLEPNTDLVALDGMRSSYRKFVYDSAKSVGVGIIPLPLSGKFSSYSAPSNGQLAIKFQILSAYPKVAVTVFDGDAPKPITDNDGILWNKKTINLSKDETGIYTKTLSFEYKGRYASVEVIIAADDGKKIDFQFYPYAPSFLWKVEEIRGDMGI